MRKLLFTLLASVPAMAFSQGFQVNLHGQKQIGMGHTGTGLLQDGASVLFNPGAVAMLPENYVQAGVSPLLFKSAFSPTGSNTQYDVANKIATPFTAYGVWGPKGSNFKFGLGVYTPFGGLTDWGNTWTGKYTLTSLDLKAIFFQPTISYKLTDRVSIGGGFVYNHASVVLKRAIPLASSTGADGEAELNGKGHGFGWNAGVFVKASEKFTVGVNYRSQVTTKVKNGDAIFKVPASVQANFPQPNTFTASLPLPSTTSIGIGYYPHKDWTIAVDASFVNWAVYKSLDFDYANNTATLQDTHSPRNYKNGSVYRVGAEYKASTKWALRAGGGYASTPVQDGYVTPEAPDANRLIFTGGLGYKATKNLNIDASFMYEDVLSRTQTNIETNLAGTFKTNVFIPGISLSYHW
ncbi:OmpP1/FadL family transporter [Mucilaginibacter myungsuensis]|uniref:Outer membrane protein transport protein n=1 Tax=Mucilaginibacter myungsuensis TaxID=649104 RepID=A0A929PUE7_9SPHI|nr:outer membrane protein transport protein [Mucilaginibacter myungsuensis]MBE9660678.1 outer membrane protein transport protein [Mucilaginibacter myungsuensis]MDN3600723.1 outer membrane protein transport protein [Mucilaginibacter myungsuensis]